MKQFSFVLNILLVAAVAVLYYLHFASNKNITKGSLANGGYRQKDSCGDKIPIVAYVELDSLYSNVIIIKQRKKELESEQKKLHRIMKADIVPSVQKRISFLKKGMP